MLNWVGGNGDNLDSLYGGWSGPEWRVYRKQSDFLDPGPSSSFMLLDEREDSINDAFWVVDMTGYPDPAPTRSSIIRPAITTVPADSRSRMAIRRSRNGSTHAPRRSSSEVRNCSLTFRPRTTRTCSGCKIAPRAASNYVAGQTRKVTTISCRCECAAAELDDQRPAGATNYPSPQPVPEFAAMRLRVGTTHPATSSVRATLTAL